MAEVGRCLHVVLLPRAILIIYIERAVVHRKNDGLQATFLRHEWIVLRTPSDEILAEGGRKTRRVVVHAEHQSPRTVVGMHHRRLVHALLCTPLAIVGDTQLTHFLPSIVLSMKSQMQAVALAGRIDKHLARRVASNNRIGRSLSPCDTTPRNKCQGHDENLGAVIRKMFHFVDSSRRIKLNCETMPR